ncbi:MAG TPA: hypothetical protein VND64_06865 [Pirellulales bacterium]|nr:hypothetical protein [Pirellulales bacterium]
MHDRSNGTSEAIPAGLAERIAARLQSRVGGQVREFQMSAKGDGLVLRGQADSYYAKQIAQQVAMELSGLSIHANEIRVR